MKIKRPSIPSPKLADEQLSGKHLNLQSNKSLPFGNSQALRFAYDVHGQLLAERVPDGRWLKRLYYGSGHLHQINLDGQVISDFERDRSGRLRSRQRRLNSQPSLMPAATQKQFEYDPADNLLDGPQAGAGLVVHNKLLTYQDKRYRYDAFGRMIEKRSAKRGVQRFVYDAESRLVEVRNESGSVVRMVYDPLGRRVEKTEHGSDGYPLGETPFMWDGLRL